MRNYTQKKLALSLKLQRCIYDLIYQETLHTPTLLENVGLSKSC